MTWFAKIPFMQRHFQEYTHCKSQNFGLRKQRGFEMLSKGWSLKQKSNLHRDMLWKEPFFFSPCCTCIIITTLNAIWESNMSHSTYQIYLFPKLKLIHFFALSYKRLSHASTFHFYPSRVWAVKGPDLCICIECSLIFIRASYSLL